MIYVINTTDCTPDMCRHDGNRESLTITRTPPRTNSSHEVRTSGWLGMTNNMDENARGEWDEDEQDHEEIADEIIEIADKLELKHSRDGLLEFLADEDAEELIWDKATSRQITGEGWEILVPEDDSDDCLEVNSLEGYVFVDEYWDGFGNESSDHDLREWEKALDAAGIDYDVAEYSEHHKGSGTSFVWGVAVKEDDECAARAAIAIHAEEFTSEDLDSLGVTKDDVLRICKEKRAAKTASDSPKLQAQDR